MVTLTKVSSLEERVGASPALPRTDSPQIKALRAAIETGGSEEVAKFWEKVKSTGAPLIEPLEGDEKRMLVTFLWKGTPETRNVSVLWFPFLARWPDDYRMERLGEFWPLLKQTYQEWDRHQAPTKDPSDC